MGWNGCGGLCAIARDAANISITAFASARRIHDGLYPMHKERPFFRNCAARHHGSKIGFVRDNRILGRCSARVPRTGTPHCLESRHVVTTKSRGGWRRWLLRGALTLPWPRRCLGAIRCVSGHRGHLGLSHGDIAPVHAARHAAVDSIAEIARAGVGVNRVCVWSSLLRSEIEVADDPVTMGVLSVANIASG